MARTKKAPPLAYREFVFHVRAPSLSYGFGIEHDRRKRDWRPFDEHHTLNFTTDCIYPDPFNGREGKAVIYPEPAFLEHNLDQDDVRREWIGHIHATKGQFETVLWLPPSVCWSLGEAMASGLVRSMLTNGPVEPRGMHRVVWASFHGQEFDPVEYVG